MYDALRHDRERNDVIVATVWGWGELTIGSGKSSYKHLYFHK
jgi:hypothetical protein